MTAGNIAPPGTGPEPRPLLPFGKLAPILAGAAFGLLLRLVFSGDPGSRWAAMAGPFILCMPFAVGAVTVYLAERVERRSVAYYLGAPAAACSLMVMGSLAILIEGIICAIVIVPLFAALAAVGGLVMGLICRATRWPRPSAYGFAVLPLLMAFALPGGPGPEHLGQVERSIVIAASPDEIWAHLHDIRNIRPDEVNGSLAYRIGVPRPLQAVTEDTPEGRVRRIQWDKGVHFDEVIHDWDPGRHLRWTFRFAPDSIPPGALDDHVAIGGAYFDMRDTAYTLVREGDRTRLHLRISYRLSTDFNAYADLWAQALMADFAETMLALYKTRAEAAS
ncbi:MAG: SRPBCC family protein [Burkholderiaceae bacterium]|nr:SRPBCC family protein [Burkholderiaceae bacterium]